MPLSLHLHVQAPVILSALSNGDGTHPFKDRLLVRAMHSSSAQPGNGFAVTAACAVWHTSLG
jgi:hypothetical protein